MEQEQVLIQLGRGTVVTAELFLKLFGTVASSVYGIYMASKESKHFSKEVDWNKMMATSDKKEIQEVMSHEVNVEALKSELESYGIGFSTYQKKDGATSFLFKSKDREVVSQAFQNMVSSIVKNPKDFDEKFSKKPQEKTFQEKLDQAVSVEKLNRQQLSVSVHSKEIPNPLAK